MRVPARLVPTRWLCRGSHIADMPSPTRLDEGERGMDAFMVVLVRLSYDLLFWSDHQFLRHPNDARRLARNGL
jgi:hypothetical protein